MSTKKELEIIELIIGVGIGEKRHLLGSPQVKKFKAVFYEQTDTNKVGKIREINFDSHTLITDNDYDVIYAIEECQDYINKLNVGETMFFQANMDNESSKGFIVRIA